MKVSLFSIKVESTRIVKHDKTWPQYSIKRKKKNITNASDQWIEGEMAANKGEYIQYIKEV